MICNINKECLYSESGSRKRTGKTSFLFAVCRLAQPHRNSRLPAAHLERHAKSGERDFLGKASKALSAGRGRVGNFAPCLRRLLARTRGKHDYERFILRSAEDEIFSAKPRKHCRREGDASGTLHRAPPPPRANSWETRLRAAHLERHAKSPP